MKLISFYVGASLFTNVPNKPQENFDKVFPKSFKGLLILLENTFKILMIFVKTCPGIINTTHLIHQRFD